MKIGIVTQPLSRNYGGILQNYSLQQTLIKLGHTPYTFDLGKYTWRDWGITTIKSIIKKIIGRPYYFPETPYKRNKSEEILRNFVKQNINLISPRDYIPNPNKIKEYNLEALIVGSDQVWRPRYNRCIEDMYLGLTDNSSITKIAYAASFGTEEWEYTPEMTQTCKELAQKFNAISVREDSGVDLCKKYLDVNAVHLIDPTMLLTADEYKKLTRDIPQSKTKYLFAYILDQSEEKIKYIQQAAERLGLKIVIKGSDSELSVEDSIEKWIANFRDANYIITDSFHGSVFSIIFNKPFYAIGNKARGMSRFNSLLSMYELDNRLIGVEDGDTQFNQDIDWSNVNAKINQYREHAFRFLTNNLSKDAAKN
ncbi:MAG: polysaccharide pyruvyl transferase family protein [Alistipes sp.]|nr:polysaccharide pyruvyl transferase family protein [Alistipes sp.]